MTDLETIEVMEELIKLNKEGKLVTPKNSKDGKGYKSDLYECAFNHCIRALHERNVRQKWVKACETEE